MAQGTRGRPRIALCGPGDATRDEADAARVIGRLIAEAGCVLICGGLGGAMEAACEGAKAAGGLTAGILPSTNPNDANQWVDLPIATGIGQGRNVIVVASADVVIAAGGGFGTLSEIGHALRLGRPLVLYQGWGELLSREALAGLPMEPERRIAWATSPEDAVAQALRLGGIVL